MDTPTTIRIVWIVASRPTSPDDEIEDLVYSAYLDQASAEQAILDLELIEAGKPYPRKFEILYFPVGKSPC